MHKYRLALIGLVLAPLCSWAQQQQSTMEAVLDKWEKTMTELRSVVTSCTRTEISKVFRTVDVFEGEAKMLRSPVPGEPCQASVYLVKKSNKEIYEKIICTGNFMYIFDPQNKVIRIASQPKNSSISDSNFLDFLFGMKAGDTKVRYQVILLPPTDKWYHYLRILPRSERDKQSFVEARVALNAATSLPRQIWFKQPNGNEVTYDFAKLIPNGQVRPIDFAPPTSMPGWREERIAPGAR